MTGILQPLDNKFAIVDRNGNPTDYFIRWAQQKQMDIGSSITLTDLANYLAAHKLASGQGIALTPDGNLVDSPSISVLNGTGLDFDVMHNLKLADTAVVPGTYGDATHVPAIVVDQQGRITGVSLVAISGGGGSSTFLSIPNFRPNNGTAVGASNFACRGILFPQACSIYGVSFYATAASGTTTATPGIYNVGAGGIIGSLLASGPAVSGVTLGLNNAPLTTPLVVAAGTYLWVGFQPLVANPTLGTIAASPETAFFAAAGALPATAPAATYGTLVAAAIFPRIAP